MASVLDDLLKDEATFGKFLSAETLDLVLKNRTLQWSSVTEFNDPFDTQWEMVPAISQSLIDECCKELHDVLINPSRILSNKHRTARAIRALIGQLDHPDFILENLEQQFIQYATTFLVNLNEVATEASDEIKYIVEATRFLCTSKEICSHTMWAHYANDHKGCFALFKPKATNDWGAKAPIIYSDKYPLFWDTAKFPKIVTGQLPHSQFNQLPKARDALMTKSRDWHYEKENRFFHNADSDGFLHSTVATKLLRPFEEDELLAIVVGCRASDQDAHVLKSQYSERYPETRFFQARRTPYSFNYLFEQI